MVKKVQLVLKVNKVLGELMAQKVPLVKMVNGVSMETLVL
jgi:hypothetical protein